MGDTFFFNGFCPVIDASIGGKIDGMIVAAGKSADEIAASKPFSDLDATWGKSFFNGDAFVRVVYSTL